MQRAGCCSGRCGFLQRRTGAADVQSGVLGSACVGDHSRETVVLTAGTLLTLQFSESLPFVYKYLFLKELGTVPDLSGGSLCVSREVRE